MLHRTWRERNGHLLLRGTLQLAAKSDFHSFDFDGGVVRLNTAAAAILGLCDGSRTFKEILDRLAVGRCDQEFAPLAGEFLEAALRSAWIVEVNSDGGRDGDLHSLIFAESPGVYV